MNALITDDQVDTGQLAFMVAVLGHDIVVFRFSRELMEWELETFGSFCDRAVDVIRDGGGAHERPD